MAAAFAGDLDNQQAEVTGTDPAEAWTLKNGSKLTLTDSGDAYQIKAMDSDVVINNGNVKRAPTAGSSVALILDGSSASPPIAVRSWAAFR